MNDQDDTIYIGIDPATRSGIAYHGQLAGRDVRDSETIDDILDAAGCRTLTFIKALDSCVKIYAAIEYPPAGIHSGPQVRYVGNLYKAHLTKALGKKRIEIHRVHPSSWIARMTDRKAHETSKLASIAAAEAFTGLTFDKQEDEADAVNLARYVELIATGVIEVKTKVKKKP